MSNRDVTERKTLEAELQALNSRLEARVQERTRDLEEANGELRRKEEQLQFMAQHDPLTGLANRTLLEDRLAHAMLRAGANRIGASRLYLVIGRRFATACGLGSRRSVSGRGRLRRVPGRSCCRTRRLTARRR